MEQQMSEDFYAILQNRIDELEKHGDTVYGEMTIAVINELKFLQKNFNDYKYKLVYKKQAE